jgi:hypothetical protein
MRLTDEEAQRIIDVHAASLAEHFPHVIISVSFEDKEGTEMYCTRVGNFYAQQGMIREIMLARDESTRVDARRRMIDPPEEDETGAPHGNH